MYIRRGPLGRAAQMGNSHKGPIPHVGVTLRNTASAIEFARVCDFLFDLI